MTSVVFGGPAQRQIVINCDHVGCDLAFNDAELAERGGLRAMGWLLQFNDTERRMEHFCPDHQGANENE